MISEFFIIILCINLFGIIFLGILRVYFVKNSIYSRYTELKEKEPFVSIHFVICNEPPNIVIETLESFINLDYSNFEVVIISNNTTNTQSWKPIQNYAKEVANFKFYHFDKVKGYKSGALNIALKKTNVKADYIFTVDSDYKLNRNALKIAVGTINNRQVDVLQFPQGYRNICTRTEGLQLNYKHYFDCYLSAMNTQKFGLLTGTLSLIKVAIFKKGYEWPEQTITEDAHFGVILLNDNFKIGFCNISIGLGTMPTTVNDYHQQYKRWVYGNFQTLILSFKSQTFKLNKRLRLVAMLSAWINLLALPIVITFFTIPLILMNAEGLHNVFILIMLSLFIHLLTQFYMLTSTTNKNWKNILKALLIHIASIEVGAFYWLTYFANTKKLFLPTNKYFRNSQLSIRYYLLPSLLFLVSTLLLILEKTEIGSLFFIISVLGLIGKIELKSELNYSKFNLFKLF